MLVRWPCVCVYTQEHGTKCCNVAIANGNPNHLSMIALRVQQEVRACGAT
jgi:hypothetical protein